MYRRKQLISSRKFRNSAALAAVEWCEQRLCFSAFTVNTTSDAVNPGAGLLSLRQAVADANADSAADTIAFNPAVFSQGSIHTITLTQGPITFTGNTNPIAVQGLGAGLITVSGNQQGRIFNVSASSNISISGLTLTKGTSSVADSAGNTYGGGIYNVGELTLDQTTITGNSVSATAQQPGNAYSPIGNGYGGGIYSTGTLTITDSTLSSNSVINTGASTGQTPPANSGGAMGGAIYSTGMLMLAGDTISGNKALGVSAASSGFASGPALGGGVFSAGSFTMQSSQVTGNVAQGGDTLLNSYGAGGAGDASGGGIYTGASANISSSTITNNSALGGGGGLDSGESGSANGGGVYAALGITISGSRIAENSATVTGHNYARTSAGGGVYSGRDITLLDSSIDSNTLEGGVSMNRVLLATAFGGGVYSAGTATVEESSISGNSVTLEYPSFGPAGSSGKGGGLYAAAGTILDSTISGNAITGGSGYSSVANDYNPEPGGYAGGGGVTIGTATITNSTIVNNSVTGGEGGEGFRGQSNGRDGGDAFGGGIYDFGTLAVNDTTITGNSATGGAAGTAVAPYSSGLPGVASGGGVTFVGGLFTLTNSIVSGDKAHGSFNDIQNIVSNNGGHDFVGVGGGLTNGVNGNIVGNNPDLAPLAYNGTGTTLTELPLPGSPVINAGSNALVPAGLTTDQRGSARIIGSAVDIGSVETTATVSGTVFNDLNGDGIRQSGEPGLANVAVYADLTNSGSFGGNDPTVYTDSSGNYSFYGLPSGTVIIRQMVPPVYRQSSPVGGAGEHVTVGASAVTGALFADTTRLYISGAVTLNGVGQGGVLVYADLNNDGKFESNENNKTTAGDGSFAFQSLTPGTYTFRVVPPAGEIVAGNSAITVTLPSSGVTQNVSFPLAAKLTGTIFGTAGSYQNDGNTIAKAFDGNLNTFFDAPTGSGNYLGLDLGSGKTITEIGYAPRAGYASRMVGGVFQGSNSADFSTGVTTLYTITAAPAYGSVTLVPITSANPFRYVRYLAPVNSFGNVAELQFYGLTPIEGAVLYPNGGLVINGTSGPDSINVNIGPAGNTGEIIVNVNGLAQSFDLGSVTSISITTSDGNDQVNVTGGSTSGLPTLLPISIIAGNGNDTIDAALTGEHGLTISAGSGNDSLNVIGDNIFTTIVAGDGNDQFTTDVTGGSGISSTITAGNGNDVFTVSSGGASRTARMAITAGTGMNQIFDQDGYGTISGTLEGQSFQTNAISEFLAGKVYVDSAHTGHYQVGDPVVAGTTVSFTNSYDGAVTTTTDANGNFLLAVGYGSPAPITTTIGSYSVTLTPGELIGGLNIAVPAAGPLTGTPIGTPGSYRNHGTTIANAFDGNLTTFFDAPDASGDWVGLDLGSDKVATQVKFAPRAGYEGRMVGGEIQASNTPDFSSGVVTLATIDSVPAAGVLTTLSFNNATAYRYYRYIGPANSYCDIAELEFDG